MHLEVQEALFKHTILFIEIVYMLNYSNAFEVQDGREVLFKHTFLLVITKYYHVFKAHSMVIAYSCFF